MRKLSKNKWLAILTTLLMVFSLFPIGAMAAVDCEPYYETPLYAGQDIEVGKVIVTNSDGKLCIKYELSEEALEEGWLIYETHWAAGKELSDIPQTPGNKFGTNPIPGQFPYGDSELDGVPFYTECIDWPDGWEIGDELFIAAHAVVKKTECVEGAVGTEKILSDTTTMVTGGNVIGAAVPANAGPHYGEDTWINQTGSNSWDPEPIWIWESMPVTNPISGDIVWFERNFEVTGTPTAGELKIACDNGYAVWLNGKFVGKSDTLPQFVGQDDDYDVSMLGDLKQPYVHTTGWQTFGTFDVTSYLLEGTNILKIMGVNEYMNTDDANDPEGTTLLNPGGLTFSMNVDWEREPECIITADETAWGEGTRFNQRGNWGWYFKYKICEPIIPPPDIVRFPLDGNAYVGYEDRLTSSDFDYNDFGMKMELEETYADGILQSVFMKFTAVVNDAGDVHDIHIARPYKGDYVYTITRSVPAVGTETAAGTDLLGSGNFDIVLFDTGNFPGMTGPDLTASVTIEITMDEANNQNLLTDYGIAPRFDLDSVFSLYNPYMANRTQVGSILLTSMFEIEPGVNAPLILVVPKTDWIPPAEGVNIATVYGDFINYYDTELAMYENWFI